MNQQTIEMVDAVAAMDTTKSIAAEWDKIVEEIGNTNSSADIVASVICAITRSGNGNFVLKES